MPKSLTAILAGVLLTFVAGCQTGPETTAPKATASNGEYHMSDADFVSKYGLHLADVPQAAGHIRLAPVPILPYAIRSAGRGGWIEFALHVDTAQYVTAVDVVGYSEPGIIIPSTLDTMKRWRLMPDAPPGLYRVRAVFELESPTNAAVRWE